MNFLKNAKAHGNPLSLALNAATVIIGLTLIFFNPKFLPVSGLVIFAGYLIVIQLIHLAVFGTNPIGMVLGALVVRGLLQLILQLLYLGVVVNHVMSGWGAVFIMVSPAQPLNTRQPVLEA